ncbi:hypothetical protein BHC51_09700 [Snodgrassella alvi]|nr:hypothetical protein BHC51_09700 [Snodgrassella alvi]
MSYNLLAALLWIFITYINILPNYWLYCRGCIDMDILYCWLYLYRYIAAYTDRFAAGYCVFGAVSKWLTFRLTLFTCAFAA